MDGRVRCTRLPIEGGIHGMGLVSLNSQWVASSWIPRPRIGICQPHDGRCWSLWSLSELLHNGHRN